MRNAEWERTHPACMARHPCLAIFMAFRYGLTWPEARGLAAQGAFVRRERWTDKRLFRTPGALVWVDAVPPRVVQGADFGREEFLAKDWTDMGFDQGDCIEHPGWTHFLIDETAVIPGVEEGITLVPGVPWVNPFGVKVSGHFAGLINYSQKITGNEGFRPTKTIWFKGDPSANHWWDVMVWFDLEPGGSITMPVGIWRLGAYPPHSNIGTLYFPRPTGPTPMLARTIPNPFSAACRVEITGTASDALLINGREQALPVTFTLAAGGQFTLAALVRNPRLQPVASLDLEVTLSL